VPPPSQTQAREDELLHAPLSRAIAALASQDSFEAASAEAMLRARGMTESDLRIARRLHQADAGSRLSILDEIVLQPSASLVAWLVHFATDDSADVRLRALTLLATSGNASLIEQVRSQAMRDSDVRIRELAARMRPSE
jgi:hypothetical protein